jgi:hypothetical protein
MKTQLISVNKTYPKCKKEFSFLRKFSGNHFTNKKDDRIYCSRTCANSKIFTEEQNKSKGRKGSLNKLWKYDALYKKVYHCIKCNKLIAKNKTGKCKSCKSDLENKRSKLWTCKFCGKSIIKTKSGCCKSCLHLDEDYCKKIGEKLRENPYKRKCKSAVYYNNFKFDSKWEVEVAIILDKNNIKWIQPKPMIWVDNNNKQHLYFSDFYLIDYDLYLDPKNDYCIKVQKEKLDYISEHYKNVMILNKSMINEKHILSLI